MRLGWIVGGLALAVWPSAAHADRADELTTIGEEQARVGDYTRAIANFKQADALRPRARTACLIGLAYLRRELWPQAELFLTRCQARANPDDLLPDWLPEAEALLSRKLGEVEVTRVTIAVAPPTADATVTVSSFAPDETFAPRTIHLAPGRHVVEVTAPGYAPARETLELAGRGARTLAFRLAPTRPPAGPGSPWPRRLAIIAGGAAVVGAGFHAWAAVTRGRLTDSSARYDAAIDAFRLERGAALGAYGVAAAAATAGLVLHLARRDETVRLSGAVAPGGGLVVVAWAR